MAEIEYDDGLFAEEERRRLEQERLDAERQYEPSPAAMPDPDTAIYPAVAAAAGYTFAEPYQDNGYEEATPTGDGWEPYLDEQQQPWAHEQNREYEDVDPFASYQAPNYEENVTRSWKPEYVDPFGSVYQADPNARHESGILGGIDYFYKPYTDENGVEHRGEAAYKEGLSGIREEQLDLYFNEYVTDPVVGGPPVYRHNTGIYQGVLQENRNAEYGDLVAQDWAKANERMGQIQDRVNYGNDLRTQYADGNLRSLEEEGWADSPASIPAWESQYRSGPGPKPASRRPGAVPPASYVSSPYNEEDPFASVLPSATPNPARPSASPTMAPQPAPGTLPVERPASGRGFGQLAGEVALGALQGLNTVLLAPDRLFNYITSRDESAKGPVQLAFDVFGAPAAAIKYAFMHDLLAGSGSSREAMALFPGANVQGDAAYQALTDPRDKFRYIQQYLSQNPDVEMKLDIMTAVVDFGAWGPAAVKGIKHLGGKVGAIDTAGIGATMPPRPPAPSAPQVPFPHEKLSGLGVPEIKPDPRLTSRFVPSSEYDWNAIPEQPKPPMAYDPAEEARNIVRQGWPQYVPPPTPPGPPAGVPRPPRPQVPEIPGTIRGSEYAEQVRANGMPQRRPIPESAFDEGEPWQDLEGEDKFDLGGELPDNRYGDMPLQGQKQTFPLKDIPKRPRPETQATPQKSPVSQAADDANWENGGEDWADDGADVPIDRESPVSDSPADRFDIPAIAEDVRLAIDDMPRNPEYKGIFDGDGTKRTVYIQRWAGEYVDAVVKGDTKRAQAVSFRLPREVIRDVQGILEDYGVPVDVYHYAGAQPRRDSVVGDRLAAEARDRFMDPTAARQGRDYINQRKGEARISSAVDEVAKNRLDLRERGRALTEGNSHGASPAGSRVRGDQGLYDFVPDRSPSERVRAFGQAQKDIDLLGDPAEVRAIDGQGGYINTPYEKRKARGDSTIGTERTTRPYNDRQIAQALRTLDAGRGSRGSAFTSKKYSTDYTTKHTSVKAMQWSRDVVASLKTMPDSKLARLVLKHDRELGGMSPDQARRVLSDADYKYIGENADYENAKRPTRLGWVPPKSSFSDKGVVTNEAERFSGTKFDKNGEYQPREHEPYGDRITRLLGEYGYMAERGVVEEAYLKAQADLERFENDVVPKTLHNAKTIDKAGVWGGGKYRGAEDLGLRPVKEINAEIDELRADFKARAAAPGGITKQDRLDFAGKIKALEAERKNSSVKGKEIAQQGGKYIAGRMKQINDEIDRLPFGDERYPALVAERKRLGEDRKLLKERTGDELYEWKSLEQDVDALKARLDEIDSGVRPYEDDLPVDDGGYPAGRAERAYPGTHTEPPGGPSDSPNAMVAQRNLGVNEGVGAAPYSYAVPGDLKALRDESGRVVERRKSKPPASIGTDRSKLELDKDRPGKELKSLQTKPAGGKPVANTWLGGEKPPPAGNRGKAIAKDWFAKNAGNFAVAPASGVGSTQIEDDDPNRTWKLLALAGLGGVGVAGAMKYHKKVDLEIDKQLIGDAKGPLGKKFVRLDVRRGNIAKGIGEDFALKYSVSDLQIGPTATKPDKAATIKALQSYVNHGYFADMARPMTDGSILRDTQVRNALDLIETKMHGEIPRIVHQAADENDLGRLITAAADKLLVEHIGKSINGPLVTGPAAIRNWSANLLLKPNLGWAWKNKRDQMSQVAKAKLLGQLGHQKAGKSADATAYAMELERTGALGPAWLDYEMVNDVESKSWVDRHNPIMKFATKGEIEAKNTIYRTHWDNYLTTALAKELGEEDKFMSVTKYLQRGAPARNTPGFRLATLPKSMREQLLGMKNVRDVDQLLVGSGLPQAQKQNIRDIFISHQADAKAYASRETQIAMRDYSQRNNLDVALSVIYPFHYWQTRGTVWNAHLAARYPVAAAAVAVASLYALDENKRLPLSDKVNPNIPIRPFVHALVKGGPLEDEVLKALDWYRDNHNQGQDLKFGLLDWAAPTALSAIKGMDPNSLKNLVDITDPVNMALAAEKLFGWKGRSIAWGVTEGVLRQRQSSLPDWLQQALKSGGEQYTENFKGKNYAKDRYFPTFAGPLGGIARGAGEQIGAGPLADGFNQTLYGKTQSEGERAGIYRTAMEEGLTPEEARKAYYRNSAKTSAFGLTPFPDRGSATVDNEKAPALAGTGVTGQRFDPAPGPYDYDNAPDWESSDPYARLAQNPEDKAAQAAFVKQHGKPPADGTKEAAAYWKKWGELVGHYEQRQKEAPATNKQVGQRFDDAPGSYVYDKAQDFESDEPYAWLPQNAEDKAAHAAFVKANGQPPAEGTKEAAAYWKKWGEQVGHYTPRDTTESDRKKEAQDIADRYKDKDGNIPDDAWEKIYIEQYNKGLPVIGERFDGLRRDTPEDIREGLKQIRGQTPERDKIAGQKWTRDRLADTTKWVDKQEKTSRHSEGEIRSQPQPWLNGMSPYQWQEKYDPNYNPADILKEQVNGIWAKVASMDNNTPAGDRAISAWLKEKYGTSGMSREDFANYFQVDQHEDVPGVQRASGKTVPTVTARPTGPVAGMPNNTPTGSNIPTGNSSSLPGTSPTTSSPKAGSGTTSSPSVSAGAKSAPSVSTARPATTAPRAVSTSAPRTSASASTSESPFQNWLAREKPELLSSTPTNATASTAGKPSSAKETAQAWTAWEGFYKEGKATTSEAIPVLERHVSNGGDPGPYVRRAKYQVYEIVRNYQGVDRKSGDSQRGKWFAEIKALPDTVEGMKKLAAIEKLAREKKK